MGNCITKNEDVHYETTTGGTRVSVLKEGDKKLVPVSTYSWESESPMTKEDVNKRREEFWITSPNYDGRQEIWQALKAVCETDSLEMAQAIIESAGIKVPTGKLTDGCYDELGNQYVLPNFCLIDPSNMISSDANGNEVRQPLLGNGGDNKNSNVAGSSNVAASNGQLNAQHFTKDEDGTLITKLAMDAGGKDSLAKNGGEGEDGENVMTTLRLSNNKDMNIIVNRKDTIKGLLICLEKSENLTPDKYNMRIIVKGKVLVKDCRLYDELIQDGSISIVQVFISPKN